MRRSLGPYADPTPAKPPNAKYGKQTPSLHLVPPVRALMDVDRPQTAPATRKTLSAEELKSSVARLA